MSTSQVYWQDKSQVVLNVVVVSSGRFCVSVVIKVDKEDIDWLKDM